MTPTGYDTSGHQITTVLAFHEAHVKILCQNKRDVRMLLFAHPFTKQKCNLEMLSKAGFATLTPVRNMDRAIKFYTKVLGGKLSMRAEGEMKDMWASVNIGKEEFWLIRPDASQPKKPDLAFSTFVVKNIKAEVNDLKKRGAKFERAEKTPSTTKIDGPIAYDEAGAAAFLKDSEGNLLMIFQAPRM